MVEREYSIPHDARLLVENGQEIRAGDAITDGPINPQEYLETRGKEAVQRYLVKEVQKVYRSQGVTINDKHIEIIVRQMLRKVRIDQPGDTDLLPTELIDRLEFERVSNRVLAEGGEPATAQVVLLGVTKASLNTASFLAAASFQETTRVLTEAAINGSKDHLIGLKENVIIGKLIPAGTGAPANVAVRREAERRRAAEALAGGELPAEFGDAAYNPFLEDAADGPEDDDSLRLSALLCETDGRRSRRRGRGRLQSVPLRRRRRRRINARSGRARRPGVIEAGGLCLPAGTRRPAAVVFDTSAATLLNSAFAAATGRSSPCAPPRAHRVGRRAAHIAIRTTPGGGAAGPADHEKGTASLCRPSASSCATAGSRRSPRSRLPRCAGSGTASTSASCRSRVRPRSAASASRFAR